MTDTKSDNGSDFAPIRILYLEDIEADAELTERLLRKSDLRFEFKWVTNKVDFIHALENSKPDIVLSDHSLPTISSVEALQIVNNKYPLVPFILITSTVSEEFAVSMMKKGIADYILKDRLQRLPQAVANALELVRAEEQKEKYYREIISKEKRFRALIENIEEAIVLFDEKFNFIYRSPSAARITGWERERTPEEFISSTHPDDVYLISETMQKILTSPGKSIQFTYRTRHKTRGYIWIELSVTNLLQDNDVQALVANFRDITDRKNAELQLRKNSKHFQALIENISDAIILVDEQGRIMYQSPSVKRTTGYDLEDGHGSSVFDFLEADEQERAAQLLSSVLKQPGRSIHSTFRLKHKDGRTIWIEGTITNLLADETVKACIINYRDVTERKVSADRIAKSEANLRTIFNNTSISFVLLDKNYKIVSFNEVARMRYHKELNIHLRENIPFVDILPPERATDITDHLRRLVTEEKISYETRFEDKMGEPSWYQVDMFSVSDENQQFLGAIISSEDITQRKLQQLLSDKMTAELLSHNKNLEQFAYIISHNLRSPVANLLGLTKLLEAPSALSSSDFKRCIGGISQSVTKLDEVILDLNYILQNRRGIDETRESVQFIDLVNDIKTIIGASLEKEQVSIDMEFHVKSLYTVRSYLHSIFLNLISNSIKYRKNEVPLCIKIDSRISQNKNIIITFSDNGLGIDLEQHGDKLFGLYKKFHQHRDGKGMGLYMVKTQIEMMGGNIEVESQVGKGTSFIVSFPLTDFNSHYNDKNYTK